MNRRRRAGRLPVRPASRADRGPRRPPPERRATHGRCTVDTDGGSFVVRRAGRGVRHVERRGVRCDGGAGAAGFPVAPVRWYEPTGSVLGRPFFVMDFVEGAELADERAMDEATAADFVRTMAEPPRRLACGRHRRRAGGAAVVARRGDPPPDRAGAGIYRAAAAPIPLLEEAAAWLHHRAPLERLSIVHGDAGPGNVVQADGRIVAVTDWEFAHLGDPAEDWSFCLSMRGSRTLPRETWWSCSTGSPGSAWTRPDGATGRRSTCSRACANCTRLDLFERGGNRAPNMAIIGTVLHRSFLRRIRGGGPPDDVTKAAHRRARAPLLRCGRAPGCGAVGSHMGRGLVWFRPRPDDRGPRSDHRPLGGVDRPQRGGRAPGQQRRGEGHRRDHGRGPLVHHRAPKRRSGEPRHAAGVVRRHVRLRGRLVALRQPSPHADLPRPPDLSGTWTHPG